MNKKIGVFISSLRKEAKMTQEQLAENLGVSNRSVSRWENGSTLPDLQLMQEICELFQIGIAELINGKRQVKYLGEENGKEEAEVRAHEAMEVMVKLFDYENNQKTKNVGYYFLVGTVFWGILLLQLLLFTFGFTKELLLNEVQIIAFFCVGSMGYAAGFYRNSKNKKFTKKEMEFLLKEEKHLQLKTAEEMIQFCRKNHSQILKQQKQAFEQISGKMELDEYGEFTMVFEEYSSNNFQKAWHVAVAVTNKRLFITGEIIKGQLFAEKIIHIWKLEEIKSIMLRNYDDMIMVTDKEEIILKGKNREKLMEKLNNHKAIEIIYK